MSPFILGIFCCMLFALGGSMSPFILGIFCCMLFALGGSMSPFILGIFCCMLFALGGSMSPFILGIFFVVCYSPWEAACPLSFWGFFVVCYSPCSPLRGAMGQHWEAVWNQAMPLFSPLRGGDGSESGSESGNAAFLTPESGDGRLLLRRSVVIVRGTDVSFTI
jgi:hypothetical protein